MDITTPTPAVPHNEWQVAADRLLTRLEQIGSDILGLLQSTIDPFASPGGVVPLIEARGFLVHELNQCLHRGTASAVEWNRMQVIHRSGEDIQAALREARRQLNGRVSVSGRDRAFLDCVNGVFTAPYTSDEVMA